jgi:hypothetical protein
VQDAAARKWLKQSDAGKAWMKANKFKKPYTFTPDRACKEDDPHPTLKFVGLDDNQKITDKQLEISIQAYGGGFKNVSLDYGEGSDPEEWTNLVSESTDQYKDPDKFYLWDLETLPAGVVTLRLTMTNNSDGYAEKLIHLDLQVPTPTPTNTPTATSTSMPTETPTSTPVPPTEPPTAVPPTETPPPPVVTDTITP